jgi:hypothetical protein
MIVPSVSTSRVGTGNESNVKGDAMDTVYLRRPAVAVNLQASPG